MDNNSTNNAAEIIDKFRTTCSFYIKFDVTLIAILGTVITILKLETISVLRFFSDTEIQTFLFIAASLLSLDLFLDNQLLRSWALAKQDLGNKTSRLKLAKNIINAQLVIHIILITFGIVAFSGAIHSYVAGYDAACNDISLQVEIENFNKEVGRYPESLSELMHQIPSVRHVIDNLKDQKISYSKDDARGYILRVSHKYSILAPGKDKVLDHESFISLFRQKEGYYKMPATNCP